MKVHKIDFEYGESFLEFPDWEWRETMPIAVSLETIGKINEVHVWRPDPAAKKPGIVLFSHGLGGRANQSTFLMEAIASAGFLVMARDHADASDSLELTAKDIAVAAAKLVAAGGADSLRPALDQRLADIEELVLELRKDASTKADADKLCLAGHSLGASTVIAAASPISGVASVLALSPFNDVLTVAELAAVTMPIMFQTATGDFLEAGTRMCYDAVPGPAAYVKFVVEDSDGIVASLLKNQGVTLGHFAWCDLDLFKKRPLDDITESSVKFITSTMTVGALVVPDESDAIEVAEDKPQQE